MAKYSKQSSAFIAAKIKKIKKEGIRGHKASPKQMVAVALSMAREHGMKVPKRKK